MFALLFSFKSTIITSIELHPLILSRENLLFHKIKNYLQSDKNMISSILKNELVFLVFLYLCSTLPDAVS